MASILATVAPDEAPEDEATGSVVLVSADGVDVDSAPVGIKTRASGWNIEVTNNRSVRLAGAGRMSAVELRGPRGQRYVSVALPMTLLPGDAVIASPAW